MDGVRVVTATTQVVPRLRLAVAAAPDPHLLRVAIEARLRGAAWPAGPERTVADAVVAAARSALAAGTAASTDTRHGEAPCR